MRVTFDVQWGRNEHTFTKGCDMKRTLVALLGALLLAGCASAPVEEPAPAPAPAPAVAAAPAPIPAPEKELADAKALQAQVVKAGLDKVAADDFAAAESRFKEGEAEYGKDNAKAKTALDQAIAGYGKVIELGYPKLVQSRKTPAEKVRAEAVALKAQVAIPQEYAAAEAVYQQAGTAASAGDYERAATGYTEAHRLFEQVAATAARKKRSAETAMEESRQSLAAVEARAKEVEEAEKAGGSQ